MTKRRYVQLSHRIVRAETAEHFGLKRGEVIEPSERLLAIVRYDIELERQWWENRARRETNK